MSDATYPGEFPTLGWAVGEWIEENCVIPDREHGGEPYKLTDEMRTFLPTERPQADASC